jgi:hypothetical protein
MTFPLELTEQGTASGSHQVQKVNFLMRICRYCDVEFQVGPGDILYGDRWYHASCWDKHKAAALQVSKTG